MVGGTGRRRFAAVAVLFAAVGGTPARGDGPAGSPPIAVGPVPALLTAKLRLSPFYAKHADASDLPVLASGKVSDRALAAAVAIVDGMLAKRPDVRQALVAAGVRVSVIGRTEETTDLPEYATLDDKPRWNKRSRGLAATRFRPACSAGEENLLGLENDPYLGESILVHEFAHTVHELGLNAVDANFESELKAAYSRAKAKGLWTRTYAATDEKEYWAEGVQSYFDSNRSADPPNGIHNDVATREKLRAYDPDLFRLIDREFKGVRKRWAGPPAVPAAGDEPREGAP